MRSPILVPLGNLVTVPLICWLSSALKKLQQKEISHLHSRSLLEMTATNTVSSVYQTNVVLMLEKIRLNAVQSKCTCKKRRKNLLCRKNTQATARGKSAVFLRFNRKNCETQEVKNLYRKKLQKNTASLKKAQEVVYRCSPGRGLWCSLPFYSNIICSVEFI